MKVVSVINFKGGVGKTTLTANLGAYAASQGYRVLLVDLDSSTNLTFSFIPVDEWEAEYSKTQTLKEFFGAVLNGHEAPTLERLVIQKTFDKVKIDFLSSHLDLMGIDSNLSAWLTDIDLSSRASDYMKLVSCLRRAINNFDNLYDLVLLDCRNDFNFMAKCALYASDYYIVPTQLAALDVKGIHQLTKFINEYREKCDKHRDTLKNSTYEPLSLRMLGVVPMKVKIWRNTELVSTEQSFLDDLIEDYHVFQGEYHVFQFVRDNPKLFGEMAKIKNNRVVLPAVLAPLKADKTIVIIKNELKKLGDEFLKRVGLRRR